MHKHKKNSPFLCLSLFYAHSNDFSYACACCTSGNQAQVLENLKKMIYYYYSLNILFLANFFKTLLQPLLSKKPHTQTTCSLLNLGMFSGMFLVLKKIFPPQLHDTRLRVPTKKFQKSHKYATKRSKMLLCLLWKDLSKLNLQLVVSQ